MTLLSLNKLIDRIDDLLENNKYIFFAMLLLFYIFIISLEILKKKILV